MTTRPRGFLSRLHSLIQGAFRSWVRDRETDSPRVVYEQAIAERTRQYRELKQAVAGILYMRNKLEAEIRERRVEIAGAHEQIRRAVRRGDDEVALVLIERKEARTNELSHLEQELQKVRTEAEEAKGNLARFRDEIRSLEREKVRTLAAIANASARRRIQEALDGLAHVDGDLQALENVRAHAARMATEGRLERELADDGLERRIDEIRNESRRSAARSELEELKRRLRPVPALPAAAPRVVNAPASGG